MPDGDSLREALARYGSVTLTLVGSSMWPLLRDRRDQAVLESPTEPPRRLDVALFLRADGMAVLHRVVAVTPEGYTFLGDGQTVPEPGVSPERVIAVMTGCYRGRRFLPVSALRYRAYRALWCGPLGLRLRGPLLRLDWALYRAFRRT